MPVLSIVGSIDRSASDLFTTLAPMNDRKIVAELEVTEVELTSSDS